MNLFKSGLANRIAIWKIIGIIFWWIAFLVLPFIFRDADLFLRIAIWLWYISLWWIVWFIGIMDKHPILNFSILFWFRWAFICAWMNFVLVLFMYDKLIILIQNSILVWFSPFWIILEWLIFWLIVDIIATKVAWEWKKILIK